MSKKLIVSIACDDISMLRVEVNGRITKTKKIKNNYYFKAPHLSNIEVFFEPWSIKPLVRFNHHLVNYGLAEINQFDHKISFQCNVNYLDLYFINQIKAKKEYLKPLSKTNIDRFVGFGIDYSDIEEEIMRKLNA